MFWKNWKGAFKYPYLTFFALLLALIVIFLKYYFTGLDPVINWQTVNELDRVNSILDQFQKGLFNFKAESENYLVFQQFKGGSFQINHQITYFFLIITALGINILLTTFSYIKNYLYYIATAALLFYFVNLRIDILQPLNIKNNAVIIFPVLIFGGISYFYNSLYTRASFLLRLITFLIFTTVFFIVTGHYATVSHPYITIANYGALVPVLLSIIFIIMVSYEIVYGILYITTRGSTPGGSNNMVHFLIMTLLYEGNLILLYLHNTRMLSLDIFYIPASWVLILSAILGIWGFRKQSIMFEKKLPFSPYGGLIYLGLGLITFATMTFYRGTGNDPMTEVFEDAITFSHIGIGGAFFLYTLINYKPFFDAGYKVYQYIYRPYKMPFYMVFPISAVIIMILFSRSNFIAYDQYHAGYYNGLGDVNMAKNDHFVADKYYGWSSGYEFQNHKANYNLAILSDSLDDKTPARKIQHLENALKKQPSAFAYANLGRTYLNQDKRLKAMLTLEKGIDQFPYNPYLKNNLGVLYHKMNISDSAFYYLKNAYETGNNFTTAVLNSYAVSVKHNSRLPYDYKSIADHENIQYCINKLAYDHQHNQQPEIQPSMHLPDSTLGMLTFRLLHNYSLASLKKQDTGFINKVAFYEEKNPSYERYLKFLKAALHYYSADKVTAVKTIDQLQQGNTPKKSYYRHILGLWLLENDLNRFAADVFEDAKNLGNKASAINNAIALMEAGEYQKAYKAWQDEIIVKDSISSAMAQKMQLMLQVRNYNDVISSGDNAKYAYLHYFKRELLFKEILNLLNTFKNTRYKLNSCIDLAGFYLKNNQKANYEKIQDIIDKHSHQLSTRQQKTLNYYKIYAYYINENWDNLQSTLAKKPSVNNKHRNYFYFFRAVLAERAGQPDSAKQLYDQAYYKLPFDEEVVTRIVNFYENELNQSEKAYTLIKDALELNPYSVQLRKLYCIQSLKFGIPFFAEGALEKLKTLISEEAFMEFKNGPYQEAHKAYEQETREMQKSP